jgi:ferredoxin-fold anticodon binding domain-containing protein
MMLYERLNRLIGHEVLVSTRIPDQELDVPGGVLEEVGADYLLIKTEDEGKGGFAKVGAQWFLPLSVVIHIIHQADCKKCAIDEAENQAR